MRKPTTGERLRYWFDGIMSRGLPALIGLLGLVTIAFVAIVSLVVVIVKAFPPDDELGFWETAWGSLMRTLDAGTMGGDEGTGFRIAMLVVTIGGVVVVASLISIISGAFDARIEELRKGHSRVLESDHTLILGWSEKVFPICSELCIANESRGKAAIVILAPGDKVEMEDELRSKVTARGKTKIIVRSGDPMDLTHLEVANPHAARSVIVLAPPDVPDPDAVVIKTTLALTNNPARSSGKYHIVGEIRDPANLEAAHLVGRGEAEWVLTEDVISRITVQTSRQSGLSVVYTELLDFDGDEIYFASEPALVGRTYFDTQLAYEDSCVMGMVAGGKVLINPPADTVYNAGDELILIAEDDSTIKLGAGPGQPDLSAIRVTPPRPPQPEHALVLGYNTNLHTMLTELDQYVAPGSTVTVVADVRSPWMPTFTNLAVEFVRGDSTARAVLEAANPTRFDHVIVLAYDAGDAQRSDAKTLITLLHLREMADQAGTSMSVVSEMLDDRNRALAEVTQADDFIVSDKLISLMLTQISENEQITDVFNTLFSAAGSEIYLRPAEDYVAMGVEVDFYTVLAAARQREETAIGYRVAAHAHDADHQYGVVVNPRKSERRAFAPGDTLIVLAED